MNNQRPTDQQMLGNDGIHPTSTVQRHRTVVTQEEKFVVAQFERPLGRVSMIFRCVMDIAVQHY